MLGSDAGYEVAMLLEPAPPSPLAVIVEAVQNLLKPLSTPGKPAEAESAPPGVTCLQYVDEMHYMLDADKLIETNSH